MSQHYAIQTREFQFKKNSDGSKILSFFAYVPCASITTDRHNINRQGEGGEELEQSFSALLLVRACVCRSIPSSVNPAFLHHATTHRSVWVCATTHWLLLLHVNSLKFDSQFSFPLLPRGRPPRGTRIPYKSSLYAALLCLNWNWDTVREGERDLRLTWLVFFCI